MSAEDLILAVRKAVREELNSVLTESGRSRGTVGEEVSALTTTKPLQENVHPTGDSKSPAKGHSRDADPKPDLEEKWDETKEIDPGEFFSAEVTKITGLGRIFGDDDGDPTQSLRVQILFDTIDSFYYSWLNIEEPPRRGRLARILRSKAFETLVCLVIVFNCIFMAVVTDFEVSNPGEVHGWHLSVEWILQVFYTAELILKLIVHQHYFFINSSWRLNVFDFFLVAVGFVFLFGDSSFSGGFLRFLRLFKFGKAMRAFKVMSQMKHLYAFMVCIQGSLSNFFWSLIMLALVFFMFALILVQLVASAIAEGTELTLKAKDLYGSVSVAMLTLFKASTGGDDWSVAYDAATETGAFASVVFIVYITFTQLALINIITGTFVEAAMSSLSPSREVAAKEHERMEREHANELKALCHQVDHDRSGKLTPGQFEDGIRRGRIPMLLTLLGLTKSQVIQMFRTMSEQAKHDEGQVPIDKFVDCCMQLKGAATMYEMQWFQAQVMAEFMRIRQRQEQLLHMISSRG